jgi:FkbM family methyltransferase
MQNPQPTPASEPAAQIYVMSADGVHYQMLLPNAATDYIQRKLATEHVPYEFNMLKDMRARLSRDDLVLDVGANIGNHTMFLAAAAGCRVAAFEPNLELSAALQASARLNDLQERVTVHAHALGKAPHRGHFAKDIPDNLGAQSIVAGDGPLEIKPLDSLVFPAPVKAIKIDVEGMELEVLEGAAALIGADRPLLYVECQSEDHFRTIHQWMVARNYGYWDTFNATPTHLFLPNEQTTIDLRMSRLQFRIAQDAYQASQKIDSVRQMLDSANLKYRASTEQVANLKVQLVQEESARRQAEIQATTATATLEQSKDRLEAERATLQQEVVRLAALGESRNIVAQEAEKKLIRLDTALESARTDLNETILKYRSATEQLSNLKGLLGHSKEKLESERVALRKEVARLMALSESQRQATHEAEKQLMRLDASLDATRTGLADVNQKYHAATEQVALLRQKLAQEEGAGKAAAELASQSQAQLVQTQRQLLEQRLALESERGVLQQEVARLMALGENQRQATHAAEKQLMQLDASLDATRTGLADVNQKYHAATEQVALLQQKLAQEEGAGKAAAELASHSQAHLLQTQLQLLEQRLALQEEIKRLDTERQVSNDQAQAAEFRLQQVEAELDTTRTSLNDANLKYRQAMLQVAALKQNLEQEEQAAQAAENLWGETQAELDALRSDFSGVSAAHRAATEQVAALDIRLEKETASRDEAERQWHDARLQLEATQANLHQANLKYRRATSEEIPKLKAQYVEMQSAGCLQQQELAKLKLEIIANKTALSEAQTAAQRLQQQKISAEQQVLKTRASLSFQLGYILIHGFKSVRGFIGMPGALLAWRKDVLKRRKQKEQRQEKLQALAAVPAALMPSQQTQPPVVTQPTSVSASAPAPALASTAPPRDLKQLKMATIMDEFTFGSYRPECNILQLTPADWQAELAQFQPELLFIESAWRGKDELWGSKVGHMSQELQGIVAWCRAQQVPTVFWNKEDPVHFETFLSTAKLFDFVFTTDIDCIHRYKAALGHERVYLLPFACQPANNNPIETYERKDAFCFAGAYYVRYPERTRDLGNFVHALPAFRPLEIYDRNFGKNDANYQFPPEYQPYIVGTLPFDQIDKAYKGYRYAINLNSIKQSQTMFARRVFELLASNTITVSNFSRGVRLMFGDLVVTTDSGSEMVRHLSAVAGDQAHGGKLRLAALRKVLQEHTYGQRLAYVVSKVSGLAQQPTLPAIAAVAHAANQSELALTLTHFQRQRYDNCRLHVILGAGFTPAPGTALNDSRVRLIAHAQASGLSLSSLTGPVGLVAGLLARDYYGPNYLLDMALATRYSPADVIGKSAHYAWQHGAPALHEADTAYRPAARLAARSAAVRFERVAALDALAWLADLDSMVLSSASGLAIDEFNYCRDGADNDAAAQVTEVVNDLPGLNIGMGIDELLARAEAIAPEVQGPAPAAMLSGRQFSTQFAKRPSAALQLTVEHDSWRVQSTLPDGKHEYLYATEVADIAALGYTDKLQLYFDTSPGLNLQLVVVFLDAQKQKISHVILHANRNQEAPIPLGSASIRFGLRVYAGGDAEIKGIVLGHRDVQPSDILGQAGHLLLTNHYPSYNDLYRNGFVHSRVTAYRERGIACDVFRMRPAELVSYHEFENVDVISGPQEALRQLLSSGQYKSVFVHFLDAAMWEVLQHYVERINVVVWVHGADIQPWHRRSFNYVNDEQRAVARMKSDARMEFWRGLLRVMPSRLKLVFVSRHSAEEVMEDLGFRLPEDQYTIIHNPIDTDTFQHQEKPVEQRKKVLSIRPYASATYANDLSVRAIELLSKKPWFHDMEFRMIGDGPLFEQTVAPLRRYSNVYIEQRFLKKDEIAALHKEYGIFLSPTRMDTQGVSRDEAMSSGLVPVTNAVAAIPEFVDAECGMLAPGEDAAGLAHNLTMLYENSEHFSRLSNGAAQRVRRQSAKEKMIALELQLS